MRLKSNHLSNLIVRRRKHLTISQQKLSSMLEINTTNAQFISNIERGTCQLPPKFIYPLSQSINVPVDVIIIAMAEDYKENITKESLRFLGINWSNQKGVNDGVL